MRPGFAVLGVAHGHALRMTEALRAAGADCVGVAMDPTTPPAVEFRRRFPDVPELSAERLLADDRTELVVTAGVPAHRAATTVAAMRNGKHVLAAKPACTTEDQLAEIERAMADTGRRWWAWFAERLDVPATLRAVELVRTGAVGDVVHVLSLGPHHLGAAPRPAWFHDRELAGGILTDLATHHVDQFLAVTGATDARIEHAYASAHLGELSLDAGQLGRGYTRVDWLSPAGLPTWGDGRLFVVGTAGYLEARKYVDINGKPGTDHLILVDGNGIQHIDCTTSRPTFFADLLADLRTGEHTALPPDRTATVTRIALRAQRYADSRTAPSEVDTTLSPGSSAAPMAGSATPSGPTRHSLS
jgi:predicted dehydrogenase